MSTVVIPTLTDGTAWYDFQVTLDGSTYGFEFYFNESNSFWHFNLTDVNGNPIAMGVAVVLGMPLLWEFIGVPGFPIGLFVLIDLSGQDEDAGLQDLGARVKLLYIPNADCQAALSAAATPAVAETPIPPIVLTPAQLGPNYIRLHDTHGGTQLPGDLWFVYPNNGRFIVSMVAPPPPPVGQEPAVIDPALEIWDNGLNLPGFIYAAGGNADLLTYDEPSPVGALPVFGVSALGTDFYGIPDSTQAGNPLVYGYVDGGHFVGDSPTPPP